MDGYVQYEFPQGSRYISKRSIVAQASLQDGTLMPDTAVSVDCQSAWYPLMAHI